MLGLTLFPVFALWLNSETLLLLLQQSPCVARSVKYSLLAMVATIICSLYRLGAQYIRISCFGLPVSFH